MILVVLHDFALGGTERIAVRLANAWADEAHAVTIFAGSNTGPLRALVTSTVRVVIANPAIGRGWGSRRRLAHAALAFTATQGFDTIFVPGNFHWPVAALLTSADSSLVAQVSAALHKPQRGRLRQWAFEMRMRRCLGCADAVVTLSNVASEQANEILRRGAATTIALPALSDDVAPPEPLPMTQPPIVLAAGRLVSEKGFARLLKAFAALPIDTAQLVIVGDGPQMGALRRLAATLHVAESVSFVGYVPDIRPWLDRARLFVLASDFEGYPAVIVEALAAGRPIVATDCTPATRLLDGPGAGCVVPIDDVVALSQAIARMLASPVPDPNVLAALVAHHRIGPVARAYLDLFAKAPA